MPRRLRPEIEAIIASGHARQHTTFDVEFAEGATLPLSSAEVFLDEDGEERQYQGRIGRDGVDALEMSLDPEVDGQGFRVSNVDPTLGRLFTSNDNPLHGNHTVAGVIFLNPEAPMASGQHYYDAKMSGELVAGEVGDEEVELQFVSDMDVVIVTGELIADEFQWREPVAATPSVTRPSDLPPLTFGPNGEFGVGRYMGRYHDTFLDIWGQPLL